MRWVPLQSSFLGLMFLSKIMVAPTYWKNNEERCRMQYPHDVVEIILWYKIYNYILHAIQGRMMICGNQFS